LGFNHPKGMFNLGMPSNKTLFEYFVDRIKGLKRLANQVAIEREAQETAKVYLYIMTSCENNKE